MKLNDAINYLKAYATLHNCKTLGDILKAYNDML